MRRMLAEQEKMNGEPASRTGLRLSILGGFSLTYENEPVVVRNRKAQVLLGYLALSPNLRQTREQLAGLLWSDFPESQVRAYAAPLLRERFDAVVLGHFHVERELAAGLPDRE